MPSFVTKRPVLVAALGLLAVAVVSLASCSEGRSDRRRSRTLTTSANDGGVYLRSVAATLNDLAGNVDLELQPAQPILTASSSSDGNEVLAVCIENPNNPDGSYSYLLAQSGNANFYSLDVQPGDVVRYYVNLDEETAERGIEQRTALELRVRRLDSRDPENALIIEGGLDSPATVPQRIEIWRYSDKRMDAIRSALNRYVTLRRPPSGWEPAPDLGALQQVVERANQWIRTEKAADDTWQPEPLLTELPLDLRNAKGVTQAIAGENLRDGSFAEWEGRLLAQAVWLRDIAQWSRGSATSDADVAAALFDWTVRNVQLDSPELKELTVLHPWQALIYGHGTAEHRAWVFVELARQARIDAVVLKTGAAPGDLPPRLLVATVVDDQLQLFDPELGLPIPGKARATGTLAEAAEDDSLLRQLDVSDELKYPVTAEQLKQVEVYLVATPLQLSRRSALLEGALEGEDFVKLAVDLRPLAEKLVKPAQVKEVKLWPVPFQSIADEQTIGIELRRRAAAEFAPFAERPLLWKARVLHFQGHKDVRAEERSDPLAAPREGHLDALKLYQIPSVRPPNTELVKLELDKRTVYSAAKSAAGYWLGLLSYDRDNYDVAVNWLGDLTLDQARQGRWSNGARYNLARTHEALGNLEEAAKLLGADPADAPQRHGNLVRARRLTEAAAAKAETAK
ncbi:MAG: transglutaminase domain-containing protein [Pirellulales bacterium]|nr:transglutaminase domain-containing protein [Pirellulales bacterium]